MDQSSNDAEKRNWRERLGIGAKEMPKIAGEFGKPSEPVLIQPKPKSDSVVVAKPAPMAPRATRPAPTPAPAARPAPTPTPAAARPAAAPSTSPDALAEKLRNQREAAEKLAEQRVHNAKERPDAPRPASQVSPAPTPSAAPTRPQSGGSKPKFTFADDDTKSPEAPKRDTRSAPPPPPGRPSASPQARPGQPPQMAPTRPPLGGERIIAPQVPPPTRQAPPPPSAKPGFNPQFRPQGPQAAAPQPYRPIDPATGFTPLPPSFNMPPRGPTTANVVPRPMPAPPPASALDPRLSPPPYMAADPYAPASAPLRGPMQSPIPRYDQLQPQQPLRNDQLRPSTQNFDGDFADDIFEDPAPRAPRRASLNDYSQAYNPEQDMDYGAPQRRRSSGPIILLSLLFLAALAGIGGVFYYNKFISGGGSVAGSGDAPVVATPSQPAKVNPEQNAPDASANAGQPAQPSKKQIYDRIVGDKEVLGNAQTNSTIEVPVQPAAGQGTAPAAIPMPDAPPTPVAPAAQGGQSGEEPLPLPMPPPVQGNNGTQGALPIPAQQQQQAAVPSQLPAPAAQTVSPTGYTQDQTQQMAAASQQKTLIEDVPPAAPAASDANGNDDVGADTAEPVQAKPATKPKAKAATATQPKKKIASSKSLGAKPVVLVPEQNGGDTLAATQDPALTVDNEPPLQVTPAPVEQPVKKKKTLLGMFTGENKQIDQQASNSSFDEAPIPPPAPKSKQVASVEPPAAAQPLPKARAVTGNRYVLQLASYATQAEAQQAYGKMANNSAVSSLQPTITPVSIGGSTRYRLSLGPVATPEQAASACAKLAGAGQPDCVVKRETN